MNSSIKRLDESRTLIINALRQALNAIDSEPKPPLIGAGADIKITFDSLKALINRMDQLLAEEDYGLLTVAIEEILVEALLFLARVMEQYGIYSDATTETPLTAACYFALGSYTEQEEQKSDQWRDKSIETLSSLIINEHNQITDGLNTDNMRRVLYDSIDLVLLLTILYAAVIERNDTFSLSVE